MGNRELEQAIRANRDDEQRYLVYADWLAEKGEPLGELIHIATKNDASLRAREQELIAALKLPPADLATVTWRYGLLDSVHLTNNRDWMNDSFDTLGLAAEPVFSSPAAVVLRELRLGVLRWDSNHIDVPAIIRAAGTHDFAAGLSDLLLGDAYDVDTAMMMVGAIGEAISSSFPNLRTLKIRSGSQDYANGPPTFGLDGFDLPELRTLVVRTCAMRKNRLAAILAARLPKLEELVLWFGATNYDSDVTAADLAPFLADPPFPTVRRLGIANIEGSDALVEMLARSPLAPRLEALDLSKGTLGPDGARSLAAQAKRFPALQRLDVSESFLDEESIGALTASFPSVDADEQRDEDGENRYVAEHE
jgi:uncharacterized protein (TIGR02996 family)